jgi:acyl-CoA synthetase
VSSAESTSTTAFRQIADPELAKRYREEGWWGDVTLGDVVRQHAENRPEKTAFITHNHGFTWKQYSDCADRLAGALITAGIEPGEKVAVLLPDGATVHTAFVGLERAGAILVGLGAKAGDRELVHLLGRTGAVGLVTFAEQRGRDMSELFVQLTGEGLKLRHHIVVPMFEADPDGPIAVDGTAVEVDGAAMAKEIDTRRIRPDDLFMLNSTSGTTGMPKCVMHTQNRWFYFHQKAAQNGQLNDNDVVMGAVPAPFGFGQWTAHFTPAILGAPTVVLEKWTPELAMEFIEREKVTMLACVSTQFLMMLNSPDWGKRDLSSLKAMFTGGEMIPYEQAKRFEEGTGAAVLQFFGSNETGLLSGTAIGEPLERRLATAGRVVPEMQVRLFDEGKDVTDTGRGQPGCKGPATCIGYYDDPAANKELFTEDGWMLMADICTLEADGYITVVGRKSDIIIRGGKNISAAQVEDVVSTHPSVALAAAVAMPDPVFGERVCVYVERRPGTDLTLEELVQHLLSIGTSKEILPEKLVVVDELPRSSGAKLAKGQLKADLMKRMADEAEAAKK